MNDRKKKESDTIIYGFGDMTNRQEIQCKFGNMKNKGQKLLGVAVTFPDSLTFPLPIVGGYGPSTILILFLLEKNVIRGERRWHIGHGENLLNQ